MRGFPPLKRFIMNKTWQTILKLAENIGAKCEEFLDWITRLPLIIGLPLLLVTIFSIVAIPVFLLSNIMTHYHKSNCLDSLSARRWNNNVCEEYHDNRWIEINLSKDNVYLYNDAASKENK